MVDGHKNSLTSTLETRILIQCLTKNSKQAVEVMVWEELKTEPAPPPKNDLI